MKWIAVVLVLGGIAAAADCPEKVTGAYAGWSTAECPQRYCLFVVVHNQVDKKVVGAKFGVQFIDAVGDPHESVFHYTSDDTVKPNKRHEYQWLLNRDDVQDTTRGTNVWVEKLLFDDGSTWEDDGNRTCVWTRTKNKG